MIRIVNAMNVVIIGAGAAGICAAYELAKRHENINVTILEASDSVGGTARTVLYRGNRADTGGHCFSSESKRVTDWWYEIMAPQGAPSIDDKLLKRKKTYYRNGSDPESCDTVMLRRRKLARIYYKGKLYDIASPISSDAIKEMHMPDALHAGFSYISSRVKKLPETNLENAYINRFGKKLYSMVFKSYLERVYGAAPAELSASDAMLPEEAVSVRGIIGSALRDAVGRARHSAVNEFYYPKFGPGQLWETALKRAAEAGAVVKLNCEAVKINTYNDHITGVTYKENGEIKTASADTVISTVPLKTLLYMMDTSIPKPVEEAAKALKYRDLITVAVLADRLRLKNDTDIANFNSLVPDHKIYIAQPAMHICNVDIYNNMSPYMVESFKNRVYVGLDIFCDEKDDIESRSDELIAKTAIGEAERIGILRVTDVIDTQVLRTKNAFPIESANGGAASTVRKYIDGCGGLISIGSSGRHKLCGMDAAMLEAFNAVRKIAKRDRTSVR